MVISSPCLIDNKELTSPEQTAPGKDFSNPLIVDSLLKTIWSSMHHVFTMKHWLVQSKRLLVFSNMRRLTKGYTGVEIRLFPTMLTSPTPSSSPSRITSSPSLSSEPSIEPTFEPQPSPDAEYHVPSPNESPLHAVYSHGSDEDSLKLIELMNLVTKFSERIGVLEDDLKKTKQTYSAAFTKLIKLESKVKTGKVRKRARIVLSKDEEDDSSKQGRIDEDPNTITFNKMMNTAVKEPSMDFNHNFVPIDLEIEKEKKKPAEFQEIEEEQIEKDTSKKTTGKGG
ncbi:hypothetical protein Tco_1066011 [Tanacetum coccineum]